MSPCDNCCIFLIFNASIGFLIAQLGLFEYLIGTF